MKEKRDSTGQQQLLSLMDHAPDAIILADRYKGECLKANHRAGQMLQIESGDIPGLKLNALQFIAPGGKRFDGFDMIAGWDRNGTTEPCREDWMLLRPNGGRIPCEIRITPFPSDKGEWVRISILDITERKRLQEQREGQRRKLMEADKLISLGTLAASMAHEINNPNNYILLNATLLRECWEDALPVLRAYQRENGSLELGGMPFEQAQSEIGEMVVRIEEGARRIQRIVRHLRQYTRRGGGIQPKWCSLNRIVREAIPIIEHYIYQHTDRFSMELAQDLPEIHVHPPRIEQVVINLVKNACEALEDRHGRVVIRTLHNQADNTVTLMVEDSGKGIDTGLRDDMFKPFVSSRISSGGSGFGLAVVWDIVQSCQGRIEVESQPGEGTVFHVRLPLERKEEG